MKLFGLPRFVETFFSNVALLLIVCFAVAACSEAEPESVTRNIRVIAQAEVDGKIVEGSAVMGLRWEPCCNGGMQPKHNTEAVILELSNEHTVYVLDAYLGFRRGGANISYWTTYVASALGLNLTVELNDFPKIRNATGKYPVLASISNTKTMPVMVSFEDDAKRETMFQVTSENFSKIYGSNTKFIGIWFEFTDEPITELIEAKIPLMFRGVSESFRHKYPLKDANGEWIPNDQYQFPQKFGKTAFKQNGF